MDATLEFVIILLLVVVNLAVMFVIFRLGRGPIRTMLGKFQIQFGVPDREPTTPVERPVGPCDQTAPGVRVSVAHAKCFAKRFTSRILVSVYTPDARGAVRRRIARRVGDDREEHLFDSRLPFETDVIIGLQCPTITFSDPVIKRVDSNNIWAEFTARPDDTCEHGEQQVRLTIDAADQSKRNYLAVTFPVVVTDFVFDHVPQPTLSKISAAIAAIGSGTLFCLTYLGQLDQTFGIASGTSAAVVSTVIYARFFRNFSLRHEQSTPD